MNELSFLQGLDTNLPVIKDENAVYHTTDSQRTFVGSTELQNKILKDYVASTESGEDLLIQNTDTVEEAFGKVETAILNNEKVTSKALLTHNEASGFDENGNYIPNEESTIISGATSLTEAINQLETAVASGGGSAKYTITVDDDGTLEILKDGVNAITVDDDGTMSIG